MIDPLKHLVALQQLDSELDAIERNKGGLPIIVSDATKVLEEKEAQYAAHEDKIKVYEGAINTYREEGEQAEAEIVKYKEEKATVKNSDEYGAVSRAIALQELEIQLAAKRIKRAYEAITLLKEQLTAMREEIREQEMFIAEKKVRLKEINAASEKEVAAITAKKKGVLTKVNDKQILTRYQKMRKRTPHVVVIVKDEACSGCYNVVSPQQQANIRNGKRAILCQHCSRFLTRVEAPSPVPAKRTTRRKSAAKR
jgi:predicted  nucleic acid-binding Zn-ribbon protein